MTMHFNTDAIEAQKVVDLVLQERDKALSPREWRHRIAGYGYGIKESDDGLIITTLPRGLELCALPERLSA